MVADMLRKVVHMFTLVVRVLNELSAKFLFRLCF